MEFQPGRLLNIDVLLIHIVHGDAIQLSDILEKQPELIPVQQLLNLLQLLRTGPPDILFREQRFLEQSSLADIVLLTKTIYAGETSAPAGQHAAETVTATLGNGQTTTIIVSYPAGPSDSALGWSAPHGGNPGSLPPYPVPTERWSHSSPAPSGTAPAAKPYPTAPVRSSSSSSSASNSSFRFVDNQEQLDVQHGVRERQHEPIKLGECYEDQLDHHGRDQLVYSKVIELHQRDVQLERHIQRPRDVLESER
ncbi:hypothetical protein B0A55_08663 [Friedmanniomyces simplex]|uniref:Uncharacterized protein n=1 Tax=Friedmanniomyces simplex TaxID=329884 RepID=A0A4U0WX01_9PEZI|nr:hypothetical protein B0A55_08663 [Friedmanniomyces simplex]